MNDRTNLHITLCGVVAGLAFAHSTTVDAHVGYGDLNQFPTQAWTATRYGWIDGTDADWGDSHNVPSEGGFFKFVLTEPRLVTLTFTSNSNLVNPAFSLYRGVLGDEAHDTAPAYPLLPGKEGQFNALGDWTMANEEGDVRTLTYITHKNDSSGTSETLSKYYLPAGEYSVVASGSNCNSSAACFAGTFPGTASLTTAVPTATPVPVPGVALWLMGAALAGLGSFRRRGQV